MASGLGMGMGFVAYGVNFGIEYLPIAPLWRTVAFGTTGLLASLGLSKWGSPTIGSGFAGGIGSLLLGRIVTQFRMSQVAPTTKAVGDGGAVFQMNPRGARRDAGAVYRTEAGAVYREAGAASMRGPVFGPPNAPSFKDAGASRYVPGPIRYYGPASWAYDAGAPKRYVSAHNRR
jgi:hypothetical protein